MLKGRLDWIPVSELPMSEVLLGSPEVHREYLAQLVTLYQTPLAIGATTGSDVLDYC